MNHFLILQVFHTLYHLEANLAQLIRLEDRNQIFVNFHEFVKVEVQILKNDDYVLAEFKWVMVHDYSILAVCFSRVMGAIFELLEQANLNICVVNIEFFVFGNLGSYRSPLWVSVVYASNDLSERSLINYFSNLVTVPELLANLCVVITFPISDWELVRSPHFAYSVNSFIYSKLYFFKFCQLIAELLNGLMRAEPIKRALALVLP